MKIRAWLLDRALGREIDKRESKYLDLTKFLIGKFECCCLNNEQRECLETYFLVLGFVFYFDDESLKTGKNNKENHWGG